MEEVKWIFWALFGLGLVASVGGTLLFIYGITHTQIGKGMAGLFALIVGIGLFVFSAIKLDPVFQPMVERIKVEEESEVPEPTALDVYRGKTRLEVYDVYIHGQYMGRDSVVVFK